MSREAILKTPQKFVPFDAFSSKYTLRVISGAERDAIRLWGKTHPDNKGFIAMVACMFLGDENGVRIFTDNDVEAVNGLDGRELEAIANEGLKLNKLISDGPDDAKKA